MTRSFTYFRKATNHYFLFYLTCMMTPHSSPLPAWLNMLATQAEAKYWNRRHSFIFIPCPSNLSLGIILHASFFFFLLLFFLFSFFTLSSLPSFCYKNYNSYNYEICCLYRTIPLDSISFIASRPMFTHPCVLLLSPFLYSHLFLHCLT